MLKKGDYFIFAIITILTVIVFSSSYKTRSSVGNNVIAKVLVNGKVTDIIELDKVDKPYTFSPKNKPEIVLSVEKNRIRFQKRRYQTPVTSADRC